MMKMLMNSLRFDGFCLETFGELVENCLGDLFLSCFLRFVCGNLQNSGVGVMSASGA